MNLVIVESPTKAKTISKFLGKDYIIESSYGHVRDLPAKSLGVDVEKNFEPKYVVLPKAKKRVTELKAEAKKAKKIILATDGDREGEAIAWHLSQALGIKDENINRIVFHEITKPAIEIALANPHKLDMKLVDAQQARRILDRLVGYKLSPFLWKKVARGLSAGRVQSVAVRLVAEREKEIEAFKPEEYNDIEAKLGKQKSGEEFVAQLRKIGEEKIEKFSIKTQAEAEKIISDLNGADFKVLKIDKKTVERQPLPPFTTSTLQQTAWSKFGYSAKQTMMLAQQLYEVGLITYMRTDSVNLSKESLDGAHQKIKKYFGEKYLLPSPRFYKTKSKLAQEAHEAIRPTSPDKDPDAVTEKLTPQQIKLYGLIWKRFIATQMKNAVFESVAIDVDTEKSGKNYVFHATGNTIVFDGFLKAYPLKTTETNFPVLKEKELLDLKELKSNQHFTEPPPRYNEASLIKALEEYGIGRPSTYAPTMSTIQARRYVEKDESRRLRPTEIGVLVNNLLVLHFPKIVDLEFTAHMEEDLDKIAEGERKWPAVIKEFWTPFKENLDKKTLELSKKDIAVEETDLKCPDCGKPLLIRMGRFGKFYACSGFPDCKHTAPIIGKENGGKENFGPCKKCDAGQIVRKRTKKGRYFWGCSNWPKCDYATWQNPEKDPTPPEPEKEEEKEIELE